MKLKGEKRKETERGERERKSVLIAPRKES